MVAEQVGEDPLGHLAVLQHVRDAGRDPEVVLQHVEGAVGVAHEVTPTDVGPGAGGGVDADALGPEVDRVVEQLLAEHAVGDDLGVVVEVVDEEVERLQPLDQPPGDRGPFLGRDDPRHDVEGPGTVDVLAVGVDGERDAHRSDRELCGSLTFDEFGPE